MGLTAFKATVCPLSELRQLLACSGIVSTLSCKEQAPVCVLRWKKTSRAVDAQPMNLVAYIVIS
eukprot:850593-Pelagomonas_calceolata.AAC.7